jgi:hypothetical protein
MTDGIDIRYKNLLRRSFHLHMVPFHGMTVYPFSDTKENNLKNDNILDALSFDG